MNHNECGFSLWGGGQNERKSTAIRDPCKVKMLSSFWGFRSSIICSYRSRPSQSLPAASEQTPPSKSWAHPLVDGLIDTIWAIAWLISSWLLTRWLRRERGYTVHSWLHRSKVFSRCFDCYGPTLTILDYGLKSPHAVGTNAQVSHTRVAGRHQQDEGWSQRWSPSQSVWGACDRGWTLASGWAEAEMGSGMRQLGSLQIPATKLTAGCPCDARFSLGGWTCWLLPVTAH